MSLLSKFTKERIIVSLTSEDAGLELIKAIEGAGGAGVRGNVRINARNIDHTKSPSVNFVIENGDSSSRPAFPAVGQMYFDTSFGQPIWYNGTGWVDASGSPI